MYKNKRKTHEEFVQEVFDLVGDEYEVLGKYELSKTKILMRHNICGHEYYVTPNNFTSKNRRCPKCANKRENVNRKTTTQFKQEVFNLVKNEYTVLGEYVNNKEKILIKHNNCGFEYKVIPKEFLKGSRCPKCSGKKKKTTKEFKQEVFNLVKNEYTVLGKYVNNKEKILFIHNTCNYKYKVRPNDFLQGYRCPKCFGTHKKTTEEFKREIFDLVKDEYIILSEYESNHKPILILHDKCGFKFKMRPINFIRGQRCPRCARIQNLSKGEQKIKDYLEKNNIKYIPQATFPDCKYKFPLRFDFQIFLNDKDFILLEYNGRQHYKTGGYITEERLLLNQQRDQIKQNYCKKNNIPLYIIKYNEDIEQILEKILSNYME